MTYALYLVWGLGIGVISGCIGIGGGVLIIPSLVYFFGLKQLQAQGTSLALMIPPIGLLATMKYWQTGNVILPIAICGAIGVFFGGYIGANIAIYIGGPVMKKVFGVLLIVIGIKTLL